ncbi:hypothetical protein AB1Y20_023718 [Prymnesium parvum]|uniref:Amino acid transporter transmembrane domain-containing protein n=1 Tax=Prymnesium parvum TaxID=97485 RepID=A0AB34JFH6_PRYPA
MLSRHAADAKTEPLLSAAPSPSDAAAARRRGGHSAWQAAQALFKAVMGTGIFALPPAIRASGYALGSLTCLAMAALSLYSTVAILRAVEALRAQGVGRETDGRIEFQQATAIAYPRANWLVSLLCVLGQLGSVLSYFDFVVANLQSVAPAFLSRTGYVLLIAALVAPLALLRSTAHPAFGLAMSFGNVALVTALGSVLWYGAAASSASWAELRPADPSGLGLVFGVTAVMFSCQLEAVSIEQDMAEREKIYSLLQWLFVLLALLFTSFGLAVYAMFGEATGRARLPGGEWLELTILHNLGKGGAPLKLVKLAMSVNLTLMTPITLLPATKIVEQRVLQQLRLPFTTAACSVVRLLVVASLAVTASVLTNFELITGLTGSLGSITCFTFPALIYLHFCGVRLSPAERVFAYAVALIGACGFVVSIGQVLFNIIFGSSRA